MVEAAGYVDGNEVAGYVDGNEVKKMQRELTQHRDQAAFERLNANDEEEKEEEEEEVGAAASSGCGEVLKGLTATQKLGVLCALAFCLGCQPSEPFLTPYMAGDKGLNSSQIDVQVYPFWTWSYFVVLLPIGIAAELVGYRSIILAGVLGREFTRVILIWGVGVEWMATAQTTYGLASAADSVFYSYIYQILAAKDHQLAVAFVHAAHCVGNVLGSMAGELLRDALHVEYSVLFYVSWGFVCAGAVVCIFLPRPLSQSPSKATLDSDRATEPQQLLLNAVGDDEFVIADPPHQRRLCCRKCSLVPHLLRNMFNESFRRGAYTRHAIGWSVWFWCSYAADQIASSYWSVVVEDASQNQFSAYGFVEAANQVAAALGYFLPGLLFRHEGDSQNAPSETKPSGSRSSFRTRWGAHLTSILTLLQGGALLLVGMNALLWEQWFTPQSAASNASFSSTTPGFPANLEGQPGMGAIWIHLCIPYTVSVFCGSFGRCFCVISIAQEIKGHHFAAVFSANLFFSLALATIAQLVAASVLQLDSADFIIVCGVLALLGTISQMVLKVLFPVPQAKLLNQT